MTNPFHGEVEIEIGGRVRKLRYPLKILVELQRRFDNKPIVEIFQELDKFNVEVLLALLHLGLKADDPELTEDQVAEWDMNLVQVAGIVAGAISVSLAPPGKKSGKRKAPKK